LKNENQNYLNNLKTKIKNQNYLNNFIHATKKRQGVCPALVFYLRQLEISGNSQKRFISF
jgi:hypothetical protein